MSMEKKRTITSVEQQKENALCVARNGHTERMSLTHIQKLVHLLDSSDIAEIELNRANEGLHLVLRKPQEPVRSTQVSDVEYVNVSGESTPSNQPATTPDLHGLRAPLVGIFHPWLKPHSKALVAVDDLVKVDQTLGTIEALNILNEVKATVAGRVVEVLIQDGQPVEYGQVLITIDSSDGGK